MAKTSLPPGFRFHPTDLELVWYYLKRKIMGKPFRFEAISELELYKFAPWDLPDKSCLRSKDLEWYFFCPRDRKYSQGSRTNRATDIGYWKTTGKDRSIVHDTRIVGMKKTLIFYVGKAPQGSRTDWVMYEFRLESEELVNAGYTQDAYVLCKIFQKSGPGPRNGEQYGAPFKEEDWEDDADIEDTGLFPSTSAAGHAHLFDPVPSQAVLAPEVGGRSSILSNFEVGEPSSVLSNVEVGEPSFVPEMSKIGELSSMQGFPEVHETSCIPEPFWDDGILFDQLETFLNSSPARPENANDAPLPEPTEGTSLCGTTGFDQELHPSLEEFANEDYVELNDIGFMGKWNPELVAPGDCHYPLANDGSYGLGNIFPDNVADPCAVSDLQLTRFADVQLPSTFEDHHLP